MNSIGLNEIGLNRIYANTARANYIGTPVIDASVQMQEIPEWIKNNIVFWYDVEKQGATNETLKNDPFLHDLSGNDHPLKLDNFLFTEMSGICSNTLVADGVSDRGVVQNLNYGVKTLLFACEPFNFGMLYDQRSPSGSAFGIYAEANTIAYRSRNVSGLTYIDGVLNTSIQTAQLQNKKQVICIVNKGANENNTQRPMFFVDFYGRSGFAKVAFKAALGLNIECTSDQVLELVNSKMFNKYLSK